MKKKKIVSLKRQVSIIIGAGIAISNMLLVLLLSYNVLIAMSGFSIEINGELVEYHFVDGLEKKLLFIGISIGITATSLGVFITSYFVKRQMRPMKQLADRMTKIDKENLNEYIEVDTSVMEAKVLIESFNNMTRRVGEAFENQKNLTSYIAHELRTPLAVIQTKLDVYKKMPDSDKNPDLLVEMMDGQISKLKLLINQILEFSNIQRVELKELVPIQILIEEVFEDLADKAEEKNIDLILDGDTKIKEDLMKVEVRGNHELLYQAFYNLIENAIKYNKINGIVRVEIEMYRSKINVNIQNTGRCIPKSEREKIFEPFYRCQNEETIKKEGNGIGLSLAKKIIKHHNGTIDIIETEEFSNCFQIQLKKFERNKICDY